MDGLRDTTQDPKEFSGHKVFVLKVARLLVGGLILVCSGCSNQEEEIVGVGSGIDELKESVCPCGDVFYRNGIWLS